MIFSDPAEGGEVHGTRAVGRLHASRGADARCGGSDDARHDQGVGPQAQICLWHVHGVAKAQ
jgi:hypothetical protein